MSARATLQEALRAWLVGAGAGTVIFADQDGDRPALPYLTVKVRLSDLVHGGDAVHYRDDLSVVGVGERRGAATVQAFGEAAIEALEEAVSLLPLPTAQATLVAAGVTVEPTGGLLDLTGVIDSHSEARAARDFDLLYQRISGGEAFVDAATVEATEALGDRTTSTTYDVS